MEQLTTISLDPIGVLRTPYQQDGFCPSQPPDRDEGIVRIELKNDLGAGLRDLASFSHIVVLYYMDRANFDKLDTTPVWAKGRNVGLFASRSPHRPCPIATSVVRLKSIKGTTLTTTPIDAFDKTPVLDIKPYIPSIDAMSDANHGWIEELSGWRHILEHVRAVAHEHGDRRHQHDHDQSHDNDGVIAHTHIHDENKAQ